MNLRKWLGLAAAIIGGSSLDLWAADGAPAQAAVLKPEARLAIVGDSITEQKQYSRMIETYLTACTPALRVTVFQFGWGGETAGGFLRRMDNDLRDFKPTVVTTCYGMNDGGYRAYDPSIGKRYEEPLAAIVDKLKKAGATVVVGSPGAVDTKFFTRGGVADIAQVYNESLATLGGLAKKAATQAGMPFADVHQPMMDAMAKGKTALGEDYDVCGRDGVHPGANGHLVMAYAFLKALGLDGDLGTITVDMKGQATATDGHKVLSGAGGKVEIESSRYVFCFTGDAKSAGGTRSILPYVPFNADLNRLLLIVKNLDQPGAKVTWGKQTREFTKAQLEAGVNLAAEFVDGNPFAAAFAKVDEAVAAKQNFETFMIKSFISNLPPVVQALAGDAEAQSAAELLRRRMVAREETLDAAVKRAVVPVKHTIIIQAP